MPSPRRTRPDSDLMTIEELLAFTDSRPDDECRELIEGHLVMQGAPSGIHQTITLDIGHRLGVYRRVPNRGQYVTVALPALGIAVPCAEICSDTPLAGTEA